MARTRRYYLLCGLGMGAGALLGGLFRKKDGNEPGMSLLRPPGALPVPRFLAACVKCGQCVEACPFDTLLMAGSRAGAAVGTPYVDARRVPCHLCQGYDALKCIAACPTGALQLVEDPRRIRMGTATILRDRCLAYNRVVCRSCWHACPFPNEAIRFDEMLRPVISEEHCIGCGLCTRACPTEPTSIPIRPEGQEEFSAGLGEMLGGA